jgi:hypothetical protein
MSGEWTDLSVEELSRVKEFCASWHPLVEGATWLPRLVAEVERRRAQVASIADGIQHLSDLAAEISKCALNRSSTKRLWERFDEIASAIVTPDLQSLAARQARLEEDSRLLAVWLEHPDWRLIRLRPKDAPALWSVAGEYQEHGLPPPRSWTNLGSGKTIREALRAAIDALRAAQKKEPKP